MTARQAISSDIAASAWPRQSTRPKGAIAQLGERVLCKHEVVGSIPSGSTRMPVRKRDKVLPSGHRVVRRVVRYREEAILPVRVLPSGGTVANSSVTVPDRQSRQDREASWFFRSMPHSAINTCATSAEGWASIMRAIKCRKGVRWMPWH